MTTAERFVRSYIQEEDLLDLNPVKARDLVVRCFYEVQRETITTVREQLHLSASDEDLHDSVVTTIKLTFADVGADFEKPTKGSLMKVVQALAEKCAAWGTPAEIIDHHREQIAKVFQRLPDDLPEVPSNENGDTSEASEVERVRFIRHKGKNILLLDFSGCTAEEVLILIEEGKKVIRSHPEQSLLTLTNVKDARYDSRVVTAMKEFAAHNKPYVRKGSVVGISVLQKVVFDAITRFSGRDLQSFNDLVKAKDYLAED